jgi:hypothetical protein
MPSRYKGIIRTLEIEVTPGEGESKIREIRRQVKAPAGVAEASSGQYYSEIQLIPETDHLRVIDA